MRVLGVDPGLVHCGWAVLEDGKTIAVGTLVPPAVEKHTINTTLAYLIPELDKIVGQYFPTAAAVEQVAWYGTRKRITLPLSHVAGAIVGLLLARGITTYLLLANMKTAKVRRRKAWDEHQYDAVVLAKVIHDYNVAEDAGDNSYLQKRSAVGQRRIIARPNAHGKRSKRDRAG